MPSKPKFKYVPVKFKPIPFKPLRWDRIDLWILSPGSEGSWGENWTVESQAISPSGKPVTYIAKAIADTKKDAKSIAIGLAKQTVESLWAPRAVVLDDVGNVLADFVISPCAVRNKV
jgi:hypothetical protein